MDRNKELEDLGSLFFTRSECEIILDGGDDPWLRGKLMRVAKMRKSIFEMSESGSSVAQEMALKLYGEMELKEIEENHG